MESSASHSSSTLKLAPSDCLRRADPAEADDARAQLAAKRSWYHFGRRRTTRQPDDSDTYSVRSSVTNIQDATREEDERSTFDTQSVLLDTDNPELEDLPDDKDIYKWAVLYENQRGGYLFSTPYYSANTLLPFDPPSYTIPSTSGHVRRGQPTVSLDAYPLPDGTWRWVSRAWMVDMRGDGQVQFDGFEYAWSFRSRRWRPLVGPLSAGGWVRRRRWVRLMVRPARSKLVEAEAEQAMGPPELLELSHLEAGATRPPSVAPTAMDNDEEDENDIWREDGNDWLRCRVVLKDLSTDNRRLELWKRWLALPLGSPTVTTELEMRAAARARAPSDLPAIHEHEIAEHVVSADTRSDVESLVEVAPKDAVASMLRQHGDGVIQTFVYPDSRARFVEILTAAGLIEDLRAGLGVSDTKDILGFWSYGAL